MVTNVLIADDASFIREILKTIAVKQGWRVVGEAIDGEEAVAIAKELNPDVILMDIVMPKMNGIEAAKLIMKSHPEISIIGLSTVDNEEIMARAIETGFVSYITKPFDNGAIISAVREATQKREKKSG
jgi:two-component system chemotaxis response regulator CheY